jgi:hypothetical protein
MSENPIRVFRRIAAEAGLVWSADHEQALSEIEVYMADKIEPRNIEQVRLWQGAWSAICDLLLAHLKEAITFPLERLERSTGPERKRCRDMSWCATALENGWVDGQEGCSGWRMEQCNDDRLLE